MSLEASLTLATEVGIPLIGHAKRVGSTRYIPHDTIQEAVTPLATTIGGDATAMYARVCDYLILRGWKKATTDELNGYVEQRPAAKP